MKSMPKIPTLKFMIGLFSLVMLISLNQPSTSIFADNRSTVHTSIPAPLALQSYTKMIVQELSEQPIFTSWKKSTLEYFPLGPGTHSWLVTVTMDQEEIGYLIFTAEDQKSTKYVLSEYGLSPSLPYQSSALSEFLEDPAFISTNPKYLYPTSIQSLYSPMLPIWRLSFGEQTTLYLNAITMDVLPWDDTHWNQLKSQSSTLQPKQFLIKEKAFISKSGVSQQKQRDPMANLQWITQPRLALFSDQEVVSYIHKHKPLIFSAPYHNDDLGAPFILSGFHKWTANLDPQQHIYYVDTGSIGHRYLPLTLLRSKGQFHSLP
ncbi:hypothetical protein [Paenibacillus sp. CMAA1364]